MLDLEQIIWSVNVAVMGWILRQYFLLRKEVNLINLSLIKNYATNEALEKLIHNQDKVLDALHNIKIDQARIFEKMERYTDALGKKNKPV